MERTACASIQPCLQAGESSVGAEINLRHLEPTSIGDRLRCESHVLNVEGRKVTFKIQAWDSKVKIGEATHVRYIIDNKRFLEKLG
jgi:predicted thioesterase